MSILSKSDNYWRLKAELADILVFDMDGTLIESDFANFLAYKAAIEEIAPEWKRLLFNPNLRVTRKVLSSIYPGITKQQVDSITKLKDYIYPQFLSSTVSNDILVDLIMNSIDKKLILATNSRKERAKVLLSHHGLFDKFDQKLFGDASSPQKKYLKIAEILGGKVTSAVVFEDDQDEINSALKYGFDIRNVINVKGWFYEKLLLEH